MSELALQDLLWAVRRLPKALKEVMKAEGGKRMFVAGGYLRSCITREPVNDIDVFSTTKEAAEIYANRLSVVGKKPIETDNALTVKMERHVVQFIHRWTFDDPKDCIASFDFTIAKAAIWYDVTDPPGNSRWHSTCEDTFYADLAARRLVYCSPVRNEDAGGSMLRVLKFYQSGYRIPLDSLGAVIARLVSGIDEGKLAAAHNLNLNGSLEAARAKVITGLLREVDPLVDPDSIGHIDSIPPETLE